MAFQCPRCRAEIDRNFKACPHCGEAITDFVRRYSDEPIDGKYKIVERLGAGGMGEVYKVEHVFLGTTRVVKVIRPQIAESSEAHERFLREAKLATRVQHPNVATIQDFAALPDGSHYMVSDFIEGENIAQLMRRQQNVFPAQRAVRLAAQAARGLEAIHKAGIVHRDISPENLMVTHNDEVKIIDLGVAKSEDLDHAVTKTGIFVGKLRYASPEHLGIMPEGEKLDGRADVYSLGVVLFEMLTGRPPFEATSPHQYLMHHASGSQVIPIPVLPPDMPAQLKNVLLRALERNRAKRFSSAAEMAAALEQIAPSLSDASTDATIRLAPAAPTIVTRPPAAQPAKKGNGALYAGIAVVFLLVIAVVAVIFVLLMMKPKVAQPSVAAVQPPPTVATATTATLPAAQTTIEVTQPQTQTTAPAPVPVTTTTSAAERTSRPLTPPPTATQPDEPPASHVAPPATHTTAPAPAVVPYVEGGDGDANDTALTNAQHALNGTRKVALRGSDAALTAELARILTNREITVADDADVVIKFDGTFERLGRGRKRRSATASITKNGRTVFRYEMKPEEYRVGDNPAEAFARILSDVLR